MRITLFLVLLFSLHCAVAQPQEITHSSFRSGSKEQIEERMAKVFPGAAVKEFEYDGKSFISVIVDTGFGTYRKDAYLYLKSKQDNHFSLLVFRRSNSSEITIKQESDGISLISSTGKKLVYLPKEALNLDFDPNEQAKP
ncbi:hypothetical protein ACO0LC_19065 [Undibacterium sp. JH2W]|uniref:hypothetical protein n=1 Tax=Undibacterium sp. JH2W TaxID=3413037 RepID=UPI003BF19F75